MDTFLQRFGSKVIGVLHGFDRLRFRGSNRALCHGAGILAFLCWAKVLLKDFGRYAEVCPAATTTKKKSPWRKRGSVTRNRD
jgi:hypothetical protein